MLDFLELANIGFAMVAFLAAVGTLNAMGPRCAWSIRIPALMLLVAMLAHLLGYVLPGWGRYSDTFAFAGVAGYLLGNRRLPHCMLERYAPQISNLIAIGAVVVIAIVVVRGGL